MGPGQIFIMSEHLLGQEPLAQGRKGCGYPMKLGAQLLSPEVGGHLLQKMWLFCGSSRRRLSGCAC